MPKVTEESRSIYLLKLLLISYLSCHCAIKIPIFCYC